jgi:hypothetical protein
MTTSSWAACPSATRTAARTAATSLQGAQSICLSAWRYRERHTALTILCRHDYLLHVTLDRNDPALAQGSLFGSEPGTTPAKPVDGRPVRMRVLITVKAAPNPSEKYGETVCVAGLRLDLDAGGWVRLYPVNFRELDSDGKFRKYDVVSLMARPNPGDPRAESWRPLMDTLKVETHLPPWQRRQRYIDEYVDGTMCGLIKAARERPPARSLAAIRPRKVTGIDIEPHGPWTADERRKIDAYVNQLELPGIGRGPRTALDPPRFRGWYRYTCRAPGCGQHRQGIYDWEWVALQRNLAGRSDTEARAALQARFLDEICAPSNDLVFFVGNQQKRPQGFMVLGAFYPPRAPRR